MQTDLTLKQWPFLRCVGCWCCLESMYYARHFTHPISWNGFHPFLTFFHFKHILNPLHSQQKTGFLFHRENKTRLKKIFSYMSTKSTASKRESTPLFLYMGSHSLMLRFWILKIKHIIVCIWCVFEHVWALAYTWRSEDNSVESVLSSPTAGVGWLHGLYS